MGDDIDLEIQQAFRSDTSQDEETKTRFKEHKKLLIGHLNRKWNVSFLETYICQKIVPRGLRDKVIPAEHLHNGRFLDKWKALCIDHGISVIQWFQEKLQLDELTTLISDSSLGLEPFKDTEEFLWQNEIAKKEVEKTQHNLKVTKQPKFRHDLNDWEKGEIFDLTIHRNRSRLHRGRSNSRGIRSLNEIDYESFPKSVHFLEKEGVEGEDSGDRQRPDNPTNHKQSAPRHQKQTDRGRYVDRSVPNMRSRRSQKGHQ